MIVFLLAFFVLSLPAMGEPARFVGVKKCRSCHKKAKNGNAYKIWQNSKHAKAFEILATSQAIAKAKKLGIATHPQQAMECLICHTAGAGLPKARFASTFKAENGVQCENCHGAGSKYKKKKTMKKLRKEYQQGGNALAQKVGFRHGSDQTCLAQCHQPQRTVNGVTYINPSFEPFDFKKRFEQIAHPVPK